MHLANLLDKRLRIGAAKEHNVFVVDVVNHQLARNGFHLHLNRLLLVAGLVHQNHKITDGSRFRGRCYNGYHLIVDRRHKQTRPFAISLFESLEPVDVTQRVDAGHKTRLVSFFVEIRAGNQNQVFVNNLLIMNEITNFREFLGKRNW